MSTTTARATTISITGEAWPVAAAGSGVRSAIIIGLTATLIFTALAFGGTPEWALFGLRMATIVLLLAWMALQWRAGSVRLQRNPAYLAAIAFALLIGLQLALGTTVYRYASWTEAGGYCAYAVLFFLTSELLSNQRLTWFQWTMATFGVALAFFAILQYLSGTQQIYWRWSPQFGGTTIFGPFANKNHYSGLMEMLWPFALVLGLREGLARRTLLLSGALLMIASIFLSASRGGAISCLVQIVIAAIVLSGRSRGRRTSFLISAFVLLLLIAGGVLWLATPATLARLINTDGAQRTLIYRDTLRMWLQHPWLGFGLGTFPTAYPRFRSFYSVFFINQTHNDYLQLLVECGIFGLAAIAAFLWLTLRQGVRVVRQRGLRDSGSAARLAAMIGMAGILAHSVVDFNLHIPANAALFAVLCGIVGRPADPSRHIWPRGDR